MHSDVTVEAALDAMLSYAAATRQLLMVKGHPANQRAMAGLKAAVMESSFARWIDDVSIHSCLSGARRVYMVNSGVGIEAMLHKKPVVHFGRAEYSNVYPMVKPVFEEIDVASQIGFDEKKVKSFLYRFFMNTILFDDMNYFEAFFASRLK